MKKVAVILSGCGVFDGSEIHESILTLLAIEKSGAQYQCFAPDVPQMHVINHLSGEEMSENRNVMVEAARISRGNIQPVTELSASDFDALIVPGGFGAAKNLCDFAVAGADCTVNKDVQRACLEFASQKKPAGYICIAPAMIPLIYEKGIKATIGTDADTAAALTQMGALHINCPVDDIVIDEENKVISTPAYMLAGSILEASKGIDKLVNGVLDLTK